MKVLLLATVLLSTSVLAEEAKPKQKKPHISQLSCSQYTAMVATRGTKITSSLLQQAFKVNPVGYPALAKIVTGQVTGYNMAYPVAVHNVCIAYPKESFVKSMEFVDSNFDVSFRYGFSPVAP